MRAYAGTKSADAEIHIDLVNNLLRMDYSKNKYQGGGDSSTSAVLEGSEWEKLSYIKQIAHVILDQLFIFTIGGIIVLTLAGRYITNAKYQYFFQDTMRWIHTNWHGVYIQRKEGKLGSTTATFVIGSNIWFNYELTGNYKEYITNTHLERYFVEYLRYGRYREMRQKGWIVTFEFSQEPTEGKCEIHHCGFR